MAKQSIANPVVSLGLDSSGLKSGIASSMGDVKNVGSKIGQSLKSAIGTPLSLAGSAAAMAVPLNAALNIASMAASAAKSVLTAPMNALMGRESFLAEQRGMPLLAGSDAGYTGVFARLGAQWEELLADMMVALDKAFDFRGLIEYGRGAMAAVSAIMSAFLGPLKEVTQNPEHLEEMFRLGGDMLIDVFEQGADIFAQVFNAFVDVIKMIEDMKPGFAKLLAGLYNFGETTMMGGQLGDKGRQTLRELQVQWGITDNRGNPLQKPAADLKLPPEWAAVLGGTARALFAGMGFAPDKTNAADAATVSGKLIPIMEKMAQSRISTALTSDSTALVEAVTRASVAGPGQDLQQRVAAAAEENVRIAKATQAVQQKILDAYLKSDAYKNNPDFKI